MPADDFRRLAERLSRLEPRQVTPAPDQREAAVAVVLVPEAGGSLDLLLIKRAEHPGDPWSGQVALPGGRRDPADGDLLATAIRETWEEVGVAVRPGWVVGELDGLRPRTPTLPPVLVRPFVFGLPAKPAVTLSPEATAHVWVAMDELASGARRTEITIPGRDAPLPAYRVGSEIMWGMTERIITPLIELLR